MGQLRTKVISAAAGTIEVAAAPGEGKEIHLHGFILSQSANGTIKFQDDADTPVVLVPAIDVLAASPLPVPRLPMGLACTENKGLDLVSTGGNSRGVVFYSIEDA